MATITTLKTALVKNPRGKRLILVTKQYELGPQLWKNVMSYFASPAEQKMPAERPARFAADIFRFVNADATKELLRQFAKAHQHDTLRSFKEAWASWLGENDKVVEGEVRRHQILGYEDDVIRKMYISARFYLRKKSTVKQAPNERRGYIKVPSELRDEIDAHIKASVVRDRKFTSKNGFIAFCDLNTRVFQEVTAQLYESNGMSSQDINTKIKKIYENRFYLIARLGA